MPLEWSIVGDAPRYHRGRAMLGRFASPGNPAPFTRHAPPIVCPEGQRSRYHRGRVTFLPPAPLFGTYLPTSGFNVYSNAGSGPINYATPVATVYYTTYTSAPLAFPDDWWWAVRAFNSCGEEQNLDVAIELILDSSGVDITNRPAAPFGLRAFATANGSIRVEWGYATLTASRKPTGFHVYLAPKTDATLTPIAPVAATGRARRSGTAMLLGSSLPQPTVPVGPSSRPSGSTGRTRWQSAIGSGLSYTTPVATVAYTSGIANSWVANLVGPYVDEQAYYIGVRAYNAVAEEPNTTSVIAIAEVAGPDPVDALSITAIA